MTAHAQLRSTASSSPADSVQSLAPSLDETHSLDGYVHQAQPGQTAGFQPNMPVRYEPSLNRDQKLLWGTVGLVVHSICDSDWKDTDLTQPDPVLNSRERTCVECNQVGGRAVDALFEGLFSADS